MNNENQTMTRTEYFVSYEAEFVYYNGNIKIKGNNKIILNNQPEINNDVIDIATSKIERILQEQYSSDFCKVVIMNIIKLKD